MLFCYSRSYPNSHRHTSNLDILENVGEEVRNIFLKEVKVNVVLATTCEMKYATLQLRIVRSGLHLVTYIAT